MCFDLLSELFFISLNIVLLLHMLLPHKPVVFMNFLVQLFGQFLHHQPHLVSRQLNALVVRLLVVDCEQLVYFRG